ncbi:MAG: selenide, water dikinase SelD [Bdellovibrionales bacterium]
MKSATSSRIILVGGGHSHVQFLKHWRMHGRPDVEVILISEVVSTPYSGMLPGRLAGWYTDDEIHFHLPNIAAQAGVTFIEDRVVGLAPDEKLVRLENLPPLAYDFCSINVGITPQAPFGCEGHPDVLVAKPIAGLLPKWEKQKFSEKSWLVLGGGAAGIELSTVLALKLKASDGRVTLLHGGAEILPGHGAAARALVLKSLTQVGIQVQNQVRIQKVVGHSAVDDKGKEFPFDKMLVATGAKAPAWFRQTGLDLTEDGFIRINESLQAQAEVFAAGDCAHFVSRPLSKAGVYAVRQGPILIHNLMAALDNRPLRKYRPQRKTLFLMVSGEREAVMSYGPLAAKGRWVWRWKDRIDRKFMERFGPDPVEGEAMSMNMCAGCGGKVPQATVAHVVSGLRKNSRFSSLLPDRVEDVGTLDGHMVSVDGFRSFTGDHYFFGQVATLHALNDVWVSGGRPMGLTVYVGLPPAAERLRASALEQLMSGILEVGARHGVRLLNAHTAESAELEVALQVIGKADSEWPKSLPNGPASLILTKPLGTGSYLQALMMGGLSDQGYRDLKSTLLQEAGTWLQSQPTSILAATDVSGFGLIGHLREMVGERKFAIDLNVESIPVLAEFQDLVRRGIVAHLTAVNRQENLEFADPRWLENPAFFDPQTNGPFLLAVAPGSEEAVLQRLRANGFTQAALIGRAAPV